MPSKRTGVSHATPILLQSTRLRNWGITLVGHVPMEVPPAEASDAGQATIEHTQTLFEGTFSSKDEELPGAIKQWLACAQAAPCLPDS
jgi:hypothetical protein